MADEFDATIDRLMANRETIKEKVRCAIRAKAEDFPPDSTARHFLWSHSYEAAEAAIAAHEKALDEADFVLMPKDQILRKMSKDEFSELMAGVKFKEPSDV